ncbi:hypothetical protein [Chryseobacterium sp. 'Rf worker isolate 10']|uniref:hypothetical protein n=1 Tax=Chryseobacterium sp. 'Rf worker isolate 10' TaxID=2887348 RepID=UPI003D6FD2E9
MATAISANAQVGLNTSSPAATLDVVGKPTVTSALDGIIPPRIIGNQLRAKNYTAAQTGTLVYVTAADTAPAGQTVNVTAAGLYSFNGTVWNVVTPPAASAPVATGSVIYVNGQQQIAQEISARMDADWNVPASTDKSIGNINTEIIDNYSTFTGSATGNSFTVNADGTYLVLMNFSLQAGSTSAVDGNCYYGVWSITDNTWVAKNLETNVISIGAVKNFAFSVAMELQTGKTYSFYINQASNPALMRGQLNNTPSTFFSVKRLK